MDHVRCATWNIGGGFMFTGDVQDGLSYDEENLFYFIDVLRQSEVEILALQEAHVDCRQSVSQVELIAESLGFNYSPSYGYGPSHIKEGNELALGVVSKYPIIESSFIQLPNPHLTVVRPGGQTWVSFDVGMQITKICLEGNELVFINGHMVPFHYFKRDFLDEEFAHIREEVSRIISQYKDLPVIVAADFNYYDVIKLFPELFEKYRFTTCFSNEITAPGKEQQDHVFYSNHWNMVSYEIDSNVKADHYLCSADLIIKKK